MCGWVILVIFIAISGTYWIWNDQVPQKKKTLDVKIVPRNEWRSNCFVLNSFVWDWEQCVQTTRFLLSRWFFTESHTLHRLHRLYIVSTKQHWSIPCIAWPLNRLDYFVNANSSMISLQFMMRFDSYECTDGKHSKVQQTSASRYGQGSTSRKSKKKMTILKSK